MAITELQRGICRVIAKSRIERGESYVAGGVALNALIAASRISNDLDLFHDTEEALAATWEADRALLAAAGYRAFEGAAPDVAALSRRWQGILAEAERLIELLPVEHVGKCVLDSRGLYRGDADELERALAAGSLAFHAGSIRGALPSFVGTGALDGSGP